MKKYKMNSLKTFVFGMLIFALTIVTAMGGAYAFFTASAGKKQQSLSTATISIDVVETNKTITTTASTIQTELLPGSTFNYTGKVENTGNAAVYAVLELTIIVDSTNSTTQYFTALGTAIEQTDGQFTTAATSINPGTKVDFKISYTLDGDEFDDSFKGKTINFKVVAHAIQTSNIEDGVMATNIMLSSIT